MANWTVATTLERLGEILNDEGLISTDILDIDESERDGEVTLSAIVDVMKDRVVRDQFTPKGKTAHRVKQPKLEPTA